MTHHSSFHFSFLTLSKLTLILLFGSLLPLVQGQCSTVLQIYKAMGGVTSITNGCLLPGVTAESGIVYGIDWTNQNLNKPIPRAIGNFANLLTLTLKQNQINGSIPIEIGKLSQLWYLDLSSNLISGAFPKEIGNLSNLLILYLYDNAISGSIPIQIGKLTKLQDFQMVYNQLSGTIPKEIGNMTSLKYLVLSANRLSGSLPKELSKLTNLLYLYLPENQLTGPIPMEISYLTNLQQIWVSNNQLSGSIPKEIGYMSSLQFLYLNDNKFTSIPSTLSLLTAKRVVLPNPTTIIPNDVFANNPAGVLTPTNWTNLMNLPVIRKRSFTSSMNVDELLQLCPLSRVQDVPAGCVSGIYNKYCLDRSNLGSCQSNYDYVIQNSALSPLGVCAAWKEGPVSRACRDRIATFYVDLGYVKLTSIHASSFVNTVLKSQTYAPCVTTSTVTCNWFKTA
jgi:hypothetical protein